MKCARIILLLVGPILFPACYQLTGDTALKTPIRFDDSFSLPHQFTVRHAKRYWLAVSFNKHTEIRPTGPEPDDFRVEFTITCDGATIVTGTNDSPDGRRPAILSRNYTTRILATFAAEPRKPYELWLHVLHAAPSLRSTSPIVLVFEKTYPPGE